VIYNLAFFVDRVVVYRSKCHDPVDVGEQMAVARPRAQGFAGRRFLFFNLGIGIPFGAELRAAGARVDFHSGERILGQWVAIA